MIRESGKKNNKLLTSMYTMLTSVSTMLTFMSTMLTSMSTMLISIQRQIQQQYRPIPMLRNKYSNKYSETKSPTNIQRQNRFPCSETNIPKNQENQ